MIFWLRRCTEQSRTPSAQAVPWPSAITWTSTCRAPVTSRSRNTVPLPNARSASALVRSNASVRSRGRGDDADAAPAAARGGLEHQRVADAAPPRASAVVEGGDRAAAPRRDRDADLLGDQLGADLVAELAHRLGVGPDEGDADPLAQLGERRVLGDEAPADPGGVGAGLDQGALKHGEVEVGAGRGGAERVGQVGLPDERGGAVGVGVEGDRLDPAPVSADRSRTAWISRIAASPRLTMATRLNTG